MQDPNDLDVVFGSSAVFKCKADGDPTPQIKWMLNANEIDTSDSRVRMGDDGTLQIDRINARDQGVYSRGLSNGKSIDFPLIYLEIFSKEPTRVWQRTTWAKQFQERLT